MNTNYPLSVAEYELSFFTRESSGDANVKMAWSVEADKNRKLSSGIVYWDGENCSPFKTLDYEEILYVLEGTFGFQTDDGCIFSAKAGGTLTIPFGSTVRYFGKKAKLFFVATVN